MNLNEAENLVQSWVHLECKKWGDTDNALSRLAAMTGIKQTTLTALHHRRYGSYVSQEVLDRIRFFSTLIFRSKAQTLAEQADQLEEQIPENYAVVVTSPWAKEAAE